MGLLQMSLRVFSNQVAEPSASLVPIVRLYRYSFCQENPYGFPFCILLEDGPANNFVKHLRLHAVATRPHATYSLLTPHFALFAVVFETRILFLFFFTSSSEETKGKEERGSFTRNETSKGGKRRLGAFMRGVIAIRGSLLL